MREGGREGGIGGEEKGWGWLFLRGFVRLLSKTEKGKGEGGREGGKERRRGQRCF
jgi:hypothetical protein